MSALSETTLSVLASAPPTSTTAKINIGVVILALATFIIYCASPMHLTCVLVAAIKDAEETYLEAIETGALSKSDVHITAMMTSLQIKVSTIREASLRNSLSLCGALGAFFKGRSFTILKCIREVGDLEAHIEILKEEHLRDPASLALGTVARTVSLRQRPTNGSSLKVCKCHH
ncbi:hypothetical protein C8R44DRAFT_738652 [Mycena epipterygia]|nr:hypothetical protein C8R44DRAFT_738652 [Mycena epipterygia]